MPRVKIKVTKKNIKGSTSRKKKAAIKIQRATRRKISNQKKKHNSIKIFRPLLSFSHEENINYCLKNDIEYREDSSNYSNYFTRNRIRLDLIPFLEKYKSFKSLSFPTHEMIISEFSTKKLILL